jgi:hypothetical protein
MKRRGRIEGGHGEVLPKQSLGGKRRSQVQLGNEPIMGPLAHPKPENVAPPPSAALIGAAGFGLRPLRRDACATKPFSEQGVNKRGAAQRLE